MIPSPAALGLAGVAGLALGSFAVTFGLRLARGESALTGRSHCDACGCGLRFLQTVPIVSFVGLRGACGGCGARIDPVHVAGEVAGAAVLATAVLADDGVRGVVLGGLGLVLITASAVDARSQRLPDTLTLLSAALALVLAGLVGPAALVEGLAAAAILAGLLLALRWLGERRRGEPGLGLGDVKLAAALALWLGAYSAWMLAAASLIGLVMMAWVRPARGRLAFGPAIAAAAWIVGGGKELGLWPTMM